MPRLSDSMEEGTIIRWLKGSGDSVSAGEELVEIETDKASMAYDAEASGTLTIVAQEGKTVRVGAVIARIGATREPSSQAGTNGRARQTSLRVNASPLARRLARERGIDLSRLNGTGPGGRIVKRDVEAARLEAAAASPAAPAHQAKGEIEARVATNVQRTIARRMAEAKATIPEFTLTTEVGIDAVRELLAQLTADGADRVPSLNDFVIKACARALRRHRHVNASYRDGGFELYSRINIGVAVAASDTLLVPTVFDADIKPLGRIAGETQDLAERARAGRITPPELSGATFTVSNLGMFGVTQFTAILNPPQAAILAVGSVEQKLALDDGAVVARHAMILTLTCDHRVLYGADAAAFLKDVRHELEHPLGMLL
jgi:pyruvate dehydrogenase E2 component (dihydrolipoamide acetyltransferase)